MSRDCKCNLNRLRAVLQFTSARFLPPLLMLALVISLAFSATAFAKGSDPVTPFPVVDNRDGEQYAKATAVDADGNIVVAGYTNPGGGNDYQVAKFKADGTGLAWPPVTYGAAGTDVATAVAVDSARNIIVAGYAWNGTNYDIHTVKYDGATGAVMWEHTYDAASGNDWPTAIAVDGSGDIYVAGYAANGTRNDDFLIIKYLSGGAVPAWVELYDDTAYPNNNNRINAITAGVDGIAVTGYSYNGADFDILTRKYGFDKSFVREWRYSSPGSREDRGVAVKMDSAGYVIITGFFTNAANNKDIYTAKYNPGSATPAWEKIYNNNGGSGDDEPKGLWVDGAGDVYVTGSTATLAGNTDFFTARYSGSNGAPAWEAVFNAGDGAADVPAGIVVDDAVDGGVFVTGYTTVSSNEDFVTLKYRKDNGFLLWSKEWNGSANKNDRPVGIALSSRNIVVAGWSDSGVTGVDFAAIKYDFGALNAPTKLTAAAASNTSITLTWSDNSINEEKFVIQRKLGESGTWGDIATINSPPSPNSTATVTYTDSSPPLTPNKYYYYQVRANNTANDDSYYSNEAHALTKVVTYDLPGWSYLYDGADHREDFATAITFGSDNHPVVTGYSDLTEEGVADMHTYDYMTIKLDRSDKSVKWKARYDSGDGGTDMAAGLALDSSGNLLVTGTAYLSGGSDKSDDLYTRKVQTSTITDPTATPDFLWDFQYGTQNGIDQATAISMIRDGANNSVVIGFGSNSATPPNDDIFIMKLRNDGTRPWTPIVVNSGRSEQPAAVAFDSAGNIFVSGYIFDQQTPPLPAINFDWFTAKYDGATGGLLWSDTYNVSQSVYGVASGDDQALSLDVDTAGNAYVTGYATNAAGEYVFYTVKYDGAAVPAGNRRIWEKSFNYPGFDAEAAAVKIDPIDGAVVVAGTAYVSATDSDFHLIRYNPADGMLTAGGGKPFWEINFDRPATYDYVTAMTMDSSGYIYVTGNTRGGPDTDPAFDGTSDIMSLIYDYEGTFLGAMTYDGTGRKDEATAITANYQGEAFIAGFATNAANNPDYAVLKQTNGYLLVPAPFTGTSQADYSKVDLSWQHNNASATFIIERTPGPATPVSTWTVIATPGAGATSHPDTGLTAGTNYCYRINAIFSSLPSRKTPPMCVTTRLPKPTLTTLTVDSTSQITVNWDQVTGNTGYKVERKIGAGAWGDLPTKLTNENYHVDQGLTPGTTYSYRVSTNSVSGYSLPSNEPSAITKPVAPTLNAPTSITNTQMVLGWNAVTGAATYTLQYKVSGGAYANFPACTNMAGTTCTVTGLTAPNAYNFQVKAANTGGDSAWSNEQSGTAALAVPTLSAPTTITDTQMYLAWTNPVVPGANVTSYTLEYKEGTGGTYVPSGCPINLNLNCTVTGLLPNKTYYFHVKAANAAGDSAWSGEQNAKTKLPTPTLSSATGASGQINLVWSTVPEATGYNVEQSSCNNSDSNPSTCRGADGTYAGWTTKASNVTSPYSATGLAAGTNYRYRIVATVSGNTSAAGNVLHAWTNLTAPTLTVTPASATSLTLSWNQLPGETSYAIETGPTSTGPWSEIVAAHPINNVSYVHSPLALNTQYCYQVKAYSTEPTPPSPVYSAPQCKTTPPNAPALSVSQTQYESSYTVIEDASKYWPIGDYWINQPVVITSGANTYTKNIAGSVNSAIYASPAFTTETINSGDSYVVLQTAYGKATWYDGANPNDSLYDADKNWGTHEWNGFKIKIITSGDAAKIGQERTIRGNNSQYIYTSTPFSSLNNTGETYRIASYFGTAAGSGSSTTQLVDSANTWGTDWTQGYYVMMTSGSNNGHARRITGKTATALTVDAFPSPIVVGDTYLIAPPAKVASYFGTAVGSGSSATQLVDTASWWGATNYTGYYLMMTSRDNAGKVRKITGNTPTSVTVSPAFDSAILPGDTYLISPNAQIASYFGTAVGSPGSSTTDLVDTANTWLSDWTQGYYLMMTSGSNNGQSRPITGKTATTLTVATPFASPVSPTDTYMIGATAATQGSGTVTKTVAPGLPNNGTAKLTLTNPEAEFYSVAPGYANNYNYELLALKDLTPLTGNFDTQIDYTIMSGLIPPDTSLPYLYLTNTYASMRYDFQSPIGISYNTYIHRGRLVPQDNGRSTAVSATLDTLYDTRTMAGSTTPWKSWAVDQWKDYYLQMISGPNNQLVRKITANTANSITLDSPFPNDPAQVTGTAAASGSTNTKLVDTTKSWSANQWQTYYLNMTSGANAGQILKITSSDATSVTVAGTGFTSPIGSGDSYKIFNVDAYRINVIAGNAGTNGSTQDGKNNTNAMLVDSSDNTGTTLPPKNWGTNQWQGFHLYMSSGPNIGLFRTITGNTANTITVDPPFPYQIASNDSYTIFDPRPAAQAVEAYWVSIYEPITWVTEQLIIPSGETSGRMRLAKSGSNVMFYTAPTGGAWELKRQLDLLSGDTYTPNLYWIYQMGRMPHTAGTSQRTKINNFQLNTPPTSTTINFSYFAPEVGHIFRRSDRAPVLTTNPLEVSWNKIDAATNGYEVERCPSTDHQTPSVRTVGACTTFTQAQPVDGTTRIINTTSTAGLTAGYTYRFRVRAKYNATDYTAWSEEQWDTITPPVPTMYAPTAASTTTTQLTPTWSNVYGDNGYKLYWKQRSGADCTAGNWNGPITVAINTTSYNHAGLTPGTFYCYRVVATGPSGPPLTPDSAISSSVSQSTKPVAPVQPTLSGITASNITVTWSPNVFGNSGYNIERKTGASGSWGSVGTVGTDVTTFNNNTGLSSGTLYYYRVSANSSGGYSATSPEASATTTPAIPSITATAISEDRIDICWPLSYGATSYKVDRKTGSGGTYGQIANPSVTYSTSYCGEPYPTVSCPTATPAVYCHQDAGLTENTAYYYHVHAANGTESPESTEKSATTLSIPNQNLTAIPLNGGFMIRLDWTPVACSPDPCDNPDYFEIQRQARDGYWATVKIVDGATLTYTDNVAIDPNCKYRYRVRALKGALQSPFSEASVFAKPYETGANVCR
ncbi:MAG: fibronectin type III domain-containing [Geobacteraceae bacterium]|nr:MAG: fibronectin type III domain-containing [Geobacteraceae bacterium]